MTAAYYGTVRNNVVVLDEGSDLTDGTRVEVRVVAPRDELERRLLASGLVRAIKRPPRALPEGDRTPIRVAGVPLSQAIIEERR